MQNRDPVGPKHSGKKNEEEIDIFLTYITHGGRERASFR